MNNHHNIRPLRWFLLVWVSLVYLWALLSIYDHDRQCQLIYPKQITPGNVPCLPTNIPLLLPSIVACTMLMLVYGVLLWESLSGKIPRRFLWLYFLLQGGLVFVIGFVVHQGDVVLSLYLALTLGAIGILQYAYLIIVVASGSLVLFILNSLLDTGTWMGGDYWQTFLFAPTFDYMAPILFVVGYLLLYVHQTRSHAQLEEAHTELAMTHVKLEAAHVQLKASAERIEELTLLTERERMARELHDTLAQGVAGLIMQLEAANAQLAQQRFVLVKDIMQQAMMSARETLADARRAIDNLRTITSFTDFSVAVQDEIRRLRSATEIVCHTELSSLSLVPASLYEPSFRTIREGLTNVARHAQAHQVWLRTVPHEQMLAIEVQDDGVGFDISSITGRPGHYGLTGLHERACLMGGMFEVYSSPGTGTTIRLYIPINNGGCCA